ncbi:MAG TPA: class I SAM-dependent methyltransferase [Anaerolineae bacterium]|jgi:SAM-dependent methyltransferase|nr:class I SAM-dependent methyltransferase [Anaerolineae bacterium]
MPKRSPSVPSVRLLENQASWLAPVRAGLLRRAAIARRQAILDLGAGSGAVTPELARRSSGLVVALDLVPESLYEAPASASIVRIAGNANQIPFSNKSFELIFSQFTLLWVRDLASVIGETWRVLKPGGELCAIEPDYLGLIEHPPSVAVADIWRSALDRCGASCDVGRRLPGLLENQGYKVGVRLLDQLLSPSPLRFDFLRELPLEPAEATALTAAEEAAADYGGWQQIGHLPLFVINAKRPA